MTDTDALMALKAAIETRPGFEKIQHTLDRAEAFLRFLKGEDRKKSK